MIYLRARAPLAEPCAVWQAMQPLLDLWREAANSGSLPEAPRRAAQ
jgi:hypothetical protein